MHLQDPYVPTPADHLGHVTLTLVDVDGVEANITVRAEIRLMDDDRNQVATRTGDPRHYMPADWQERATVLIQEFRAATALIHDVSAAPPPDQEE
jgi:hypothetical protein